LCIWSIFLNTRLKTNYLQKQNKDLTDLVLLGKSNNVVAIFFTTVLFSVAGFPPMIGFLVKMGIFLTAIESSMYFVALISILCSVIGTFYYIKLIKILYFEKMLVGKLYYPINLQNSCIITWLFFSLLFLFINPTLLFLISHKFSLLVL
jgi:NADH-quinone oxidoreductase subunit N